MKKLFMLLTAFLTALIFSNSAYAYDAVLDDIELDYDKGIIYLSGNIGETNSGSYVAVEITDSNGASVYSDQITSTSKGLYALNVKMTSAYKSGKYTVSVRGTKTDSAAVKTFEFDASKDNFYVENAEIKKGEETASAIYDNDTLKVEFDFFSAFSYKMGDISCKWQLAGTKEGPYYDLAETTVNEYTLSLSDITGVYNQHMSDFMDKKLYLRAVVKAKTENSANYSEETISINTAEITTVPYVTNVAISGTARVGSKLTGTYVYADFQNKSEKNSDYEWLSSSSAGGTYKTVGKGLSYIPSSSDAGMYLKLKITPKTDGGNLAGESVTSSAVYVSQSSANIISGGGGGGGSSSSSRGGTTVAKPVQTSAVSTPEPTVSPDDTETNGGFSDTDGHWAKQDIETAAKRGIVSGTDNAFYPENPVTRAEFSKMIVNTLKCGGDEYTNEFSDISADAWYAEFVAACAKRGIVSGSDGMFRPNDLIKREEMAKMIILAYRTVFTEDEFTAGESTFTDSEAISSWARDFAEECSEKGFITGMPDGSFAPADNATRAQAAVVVNRLYDSLHGETDGEE